MKTSFVFLFLISISLVFAADLYVDKDSIGGSCSDSISRSENSISQPWCSLSRAASQVQAGDTVNVRQGEYFDTFSINNDGTESQPIIFRPYNNEQVTIHEDSGSSIIWINSDYLILDGFHLELLNPPQSHSSHIVVRGGHVIVRNNNIFYAGDILLDKWDGYLVQGISIGGWLGLYENNIIENMSLHGITFSEYATKNTVRNNRVSNTHGNSISTGTTRSVITGNIIENNILEGSLVSDGFQSNADFSLPPEEFELDVSSQGFIIRNNIIRDHGENAIDLKGASNYLVEGNIMYKSYGNNDGGYGYSQSLVPPCPVECGYTYPGIMDKIDCKQFCNNRVACSTIGHGSGQSSRQVIVRNNIIYDNCKGGSIDNDWAYYHNTVLSNNRDYTGPNSQHDGGGSACTNCNQPKFVGIAASRYGGSVKNNFFGSHNHGEIMVRWSVQWGIQSVDIDYNAYYNPGTLNFIDKHGDAYFDEINMDWTDWRNWLDANQEFSGKDTHSFVVPDPGFVNVPNYPVGDHLAFDFHLTAGSDLIDAGGPLTVTSSSGSGTNVQVADASYFFDGYGVTDGDTIIIGTDTVQIISVDYDTHIITIDQSISWANGDSVFMDFEGSAPDIGAFEYIQGSGFCGDGTCDSGEDCSCSDCLCSSSDICCSGTCQVPACSRSSDCGSATACRTYTCSNPSTCSASCSSTSITQCIDSDGCCPPGCTSQTDSDCSGSSNYIATISEEMVIMDVSPVYDMSTLTSIFIGSRQENERHRALIKFPNLISLSSVPLGSTIQSATLIMTHVDSQQVYSPIDIHARRVLEHWTEGDSSDDTADPGESVWDYASYNTQRWSSDTGQNGGSDAGASYPESHTTNGESIVSYSSPPPEGTTSQFDVTSIVQEWATNGENHGFILISPLGEGSTKAFIRFASSEHATSGYRPKLDVIFSSYHLADTDRDACVELHELVTYMDTWKSGSVSMAELVSGISEWKAGC